MNETYETAASAHGASAFPVPFSIDEFRESVTEVFGHYVRLIARMTDLETAWAITETSRGHTCSEPGLLNPYLEARDIGFTFEHLRNTNFATQMERLYYYAFFRRIDSEAEIVSCGETYPWITALVCDARYSVTALKWYYDGDRDTELLTHADRCILVTETANARFMLEGGAPFYDDFRYEHLENVLQTGVMTVRQLALLSGMDEERILANVDTQHPDPIQTISTHFGPRIENTVAKAWLLANGLYMPISHS